MFKTSKVVKLLACTLVLASLAGCGSTPVEDEMLDDPGMDAGYDPYAGGSTGGALPGTLPGTTFPGTGGAAGGGAYCGGGTGGGMALGGELTCSVAKKKNGSFLGMGKFTATIEISNPSSQSQTGSYTVTFINGKKPAKTAPVTATITLQPNETTSVEVIDKSWTTDDVECEVTTNAGAPAPTTCATSATGAMGATSMAPLSGMPTY